MSIGTLLHRAFIPKPTNTSTDALTEEEAQFPLTIAALREQTPLASLEDLAVHAKTLSREDRFAVMRDSLYRFQTREPMAGAEPSADARGLMKTLGNSKVVKGIVIGGSIAAVGAGALMAQDYDGHLSGVANNTGAEGSDWHTDAFFHYNANSDAVPMVVQLTYAKKGQAPDDTFRPITIHPGETVALRDVLGTTFGGEEGPGVIHYNVVQGDIDRLTVNGNTYNRVNDREQFGQQIFGRRWSQAPGTGVNIIVPTPIDFASYRANLAFTAGPNTHQVRVIAQNNTGNLLYNEVKNVHPNSWNQLLRVVERNAPGQLPGVYFTVIGIDGKVDVAMSFANNVTNDGNNIVGRTIFDTEENLWFTGAAYLNGANGSRWESQIEAANPNDILGRSSMKYFPRGVDNSGSLFGIGFDLNPHQGTILRNVLYEHLSQPDGSAGTIQFLMDPEAKIIPFMQTPNVVGVDSEGHIIAYGQNVPGINWGDGAYDDLEVVVAGIDHNDNNRANMLLQNTLYNELTGEFLPMDVEAEFYTGAGVLAHVESIHLRPGEYLQEDKFVDRWLGPGTNIEGGSVVFRTRDVPTNSYGGLNAMVSIANGNRINDVGTNDGRLIVGQNVMKPNYQPALDEVCETYWGDCTQDADGDFRMDDILGVPYNGWFNSGEPVDFELTSSDQDRDFTVPRVLNPEMFPEGSVSIVQQDDKYFLRIFRANPTANVITTNVEIAIEDHHGLGSEVYSIPLTMDPAP